MSTPTNNSKTPRWRMLLIIPPIIIGIVVLKIGINNRATPVKAEPTEASRSVRIIEAPIVPFAPTATGYGVARPAQVWTAVAQVSGRILKLNERLRDGEILDAGTELFQIDPVDYELSLAQAEAELAELEVTKSNTKASLTIEQRNFNVAQRELARIRKLAKQGTASRSTADATERTMLATRSAMQNMKNTLALLPSKRAVIEAKISQAKRNLANTRIKAPFTLRVANLKVEQDQFVSIGQTLFQGDAVDQVEITAQFAMSALSRLFIGRDELPVTDVQAMTNHLPELTKFQPLVTLDMGNHIAKWQARFLRFSDNVEADTRTVGVVVAVDKPWEKIIPGQRPPLSKGMYVAVELRGPAGKLRRIIPRNALHNGEILLVDSQQRLTKRKVTPLFTQDDVAVLRNENSETWQVVVSDLIPAVEGMLLKPQLDKALNTRLKTSGDATTGAGQ